MRNRTTGSLSGHPPRGGDAERQGGTGSVSIISTSRRIGALALATAFVVGACSGSATPTPAASTAASAAASAGAAGAVTCVSGSITASGSTALQPLVDAAGKAYVKACPGATIQVQGGGSGTGLTQVLQGAVQIGNSDVTAESKLQPADAATLVDHQVAVQGWVMVNNPDITGVTNLTTDQATKIWTGVTTNWKDVGGPDMKIVLILRPASSGTRATFKKIVLGGAPEDDLLERRARAGRCRAEDQDDLHVGPAHVLPVRGHAGPDLRGLVGCQVRHARDVWVVHHDPALDGNLVVDERRGIRGLELGLSGHVRVADLDGTLEDLGQAGARATALDLDGGARAGLHVGLAGRVDEGLERGRARRRDAAADAGDRACRSR